MKKLNTIIVSIGIALASLNSATAQVKVGSNPTTIATNSNLEVEASNGNKVIVNKNSGKITIQDGSQGVGKILTSDANGNATWGEISNGGSIVGDIKSSARGADHNGWYFLNGRSLSTLPANAQAAAASLGITGNLPDARDRVLKNRVGTEEFGNIGGNNSLTIAQANLPNVNLAGTISGSAASSGAHTHTISGTAASGGAHTHNISGTASSAGAHTHGPERGNMFLLGGTSHHNNGQGYANGTNAIGWGGVGAGYATASGGAHTHTLTGTATSGGAHTHTLTGTATSAGAHTHTVTGNATIPTGGAGTALDNRQSYLVASTFIYLGE